MKKQPTDINNSKRKLSESYGQFTTIAYQIIGFVAAGFLFGWLFDWLFNFSFPVFRLAFSIAGIVAAMWWLVKTFNKKQ